MWMSARWRLVVLSILFGCASRGMQSPDHPARAGGGQCGNIDLNYSGRMQKQTGATAARSAAPLWFVVRDDSTGRGLQCVWVILVPGADTSHLTAGAAWVGITDSTGIVLADSLQERTWTLTTRRLGYFSATATVVVRSSLPDTIEIRIKHNPNIEYQPVKPVPTAP